MNLIHKTITWLETKLEDSIEQEEVVRVSGYSFYHFHRLFHQRVGVSFHEYLRNRRLTNAALRLIYSNDRILDIAIRYQFESQEAFTRAFRKLHGLPPGKYRTLMKSLINETKIREEVSMKGWFLSGVAPQKYEIGRDFEQVHQGNASGYLKSVKETSNNEFGTMMQQFQAGKWKKKRLKISCFMQTKNVEGMAGLWMRIDSKEGDTLQFDNMSNRPITGTTGWNYYSVVLDVPEAAGGIYFGAMLLGNGEVWVDEFKLEEVDEKVPSTNLLVSDTLPIEPVNLSFDLDIEDETTIK